ncbi:hypothetical protein M426DRAFT_17617 [Hypoxylon sp. CI-4A]|nr:hypothetical protein M426DRAFT_17617 [Hypoxylon sp. CI-4A]
MPDEPPLLEPKKWFSARTGSWFFGLIRDSRQAETSSASPKCPSTSRQWWSPRVKKTRAFTAVVTLDRGIPPTSSATPSDWSAGAASSDGLGQQQIGIIVGCCIGAVVLGIILWCCCTKRCGCSPYRVYEDEQTSEVYIITDDLAEVSQPQRSWPRFPRSIPPPLVPTYVARDTRPQWREYLASRGDYPSYYTN